jgi:cytoskeletal protein RodZ
MSIGSTLKQAREAARLTLSDVSERTRIRQTVITSIEQDEFAICGGDVYARGHIRSIASVVGVDSQALMQEFDAIYGNPNESVFDLIETSSMLKKPRRNPWQPAVAVAGVALFAIIGVAIAQGEPDDSSVATPPSRTSPTTPPTSNPATTEPDAIADASDGVTFEVVASNGPSWLSVRDGNGSQLFQGIIRQGQARTFTDETNLKIVIGNAGGVEISVNGRPLGVAGANGAVVRFDLKPGDPGVG